MVWCHFWDKIIKDYHFHLAGILPLAIFASLSLWRRFFWGRKSGQPLVNSPQELGAADDYVNELEMDPSPVKPLAETSLLAYTLIAALQGTLWQVTQELNWAPDSWKLWDEKCYCLMSLSFGVICYTEIENSPSSNEAWIRCAWDLWFSEIGRSTQARCKSTGMWKYLKSGVQVIYFQTSTNLYFGATLSISMYLCMLVLINWLRRETYEIPASPPTMPSPQ